MSTTELAIVIGVILGLILLPFVIAVLIRWFVPLDVPPAEEEEDEPQQASYNSLRDVWTSIVPHLTELRGRVLKAMIAIGLGTAVGSWLVFGAPLGKPLPEILVEQFVPPDVLVQTITPGEKFVSYMGVSLAVGIALAVPVIVYQIVAFIAPGLLPHEKRMLYTALPFVSELFLAGIAFGWFFTVPAAIQFLLGFSPSSRIVENPSLSSFLSTISTLLLWNGLVFELPAAVYLMARLGFVNTQSLARTRRYAIVVLTILAALITPTPDPYNMMILAIPMYLLYELGIQLTRLVPQRSSAPPLPEQAEAKG